MSEQSLLVIYCWIISYDGSLKLTIIIIIIWIYTLPNLTTSCWVHRYDLPITKIKTFRNRKQKIIIKCLKIKLIEFWQLLENRVTCNIIVMCLSWKHSETMKCPPILLVGVICHNFSLLCQLTLQRTEFRFDFV